jgi:hypothetical protein
MSTPSHCFRTFYRAQTAVFPSETSMVIGLPGRSRRRANMKTLTTPSSTASLRELPPVDADAIGQFPSFFRRAAAAPQPGSPRWRPIQNPVINGLPRQTSGRQAGEVPPSASGNLVRRPTFFQSFCDIALQPVVLQLPRTPANQLPLVREPLSLLGAVTTLARIPLQFTINRAPMPPHHFRDLRFRLSLFVQPV